MIKKITIEEKARVQDALQDHLQATVVSQALNINSINFLQKMLKKALYSCDESYFKSHVT